MTRKRCLAFCSLVSFVCSFWTGQTHQSLNRLAYAWGLPKKILAVKDIGKGSLSLTGVHGMVAKLSLVECMAAVEDPRVDRTKAHDLQDILVLSVLAALCGAHAYIPGDCPQLTRKKLGDCPRVFSTNCTQSVGWLLLDDCPQSLVLLAVSL